METLMSLKPDVAKDLLCIIAHGTLKARVPGAHLLFYYWPALNPTLLDAASTRNSTVSYVFFKFFVSKFFAFRRAFVRA